MSEKEMTEAGALVIRNIRVIEQATKVAYKLDDDVFECVEKILQELLPEAEWIVNLPYAGKKKYHKSWSFLAPANWCKGGDSPGTCYARFTIWAQYPKDNNDDYYLSQLCGLNDVSTGVCWVADKLILPKRNPKEWRTFFAGQNEKHPHLEGRGFKYTDGKWFMPMTVNVDELAEAYANKTMGDVLRPVVEKCIGRIKESIPDFNAIITAARKVA
ncbi:MAG: hypothetical protein ACYDC8_05640 [Gammaproteobacteria bacterium]